MLVYNSEGCAVLNARVQEACITLSVESQRDIEGEMGGSGGQ